MKVLSLHTMGHDTGLSYFEDGKLCFSIETERLTRVKHDHQVELAIQYFFRHVQVHPSEIDLVAISTNIRNRIAGIPQMDDAMEHINRGNLHYATQCNMLGQSTDCLVVAHEASHAALSCHFAGYAEPCLVLINEGRGTFSRNSLFLMKDGQLILKDADMLPWYGSGFGWSALGHIFGLGISPSTAGRVMALGGYGTHSEMFHDILRGIKNNVHYCERKIQEQEVKKLIEHPEFKLDFSTKATITATFQHMFTEEIISLLQEKTKEFQNFNLALGGGCALNLMTNTRIRQQITPQLSIPPACNDAGQALGAGIYAQKFFLGIDPQPFGVYSNGLPSKNNEIEDILRSYRLRWMTYEPKYVAGRLADGAVVSFFNGISEIGPRALGNRSLLANPCIRNMKKRLSEGIKEREWFRPLAGVMRIESFQDLFPEELPSPFMLFSYPVPGGLIPEATHIDGTSRLQTLQCEDHQQLYELLLEFENQTGIPALINTSLNRRNKAIAYGPRDVLEDFLKSDVDLFVFQNKMLIQI